MNDKPDAVQLTPPQLEQVREERVEGTDLFNAAFQTPFHATSGQATLVNVDGNQPQRPDPNRQLAIDGLNTAWRLALIEHVTSDAAACAGPIEADSRDDDREDPLAGVRAVPLSPPPSRPGRLALSAPVSGRA